MSEWSSKMSSTEAANGRGERNLPREGDYIQWEELPPGGSLNRWSHAMTKEHDFIGAQVSNNCSPYTYTREVWVAPEVVDTANQTLRPFIYFVSTSLHQAIC